MVAVATKSDLGQVERDVEIAVAEGGGGVGVERLEQRRGAAAGLVEPVHLVEDEHRVADAGAAQLLDDASGRGGADAVHRGRVQPAAGQPGAGAAQRRGDEPRQRRLAHPGRAAEADRREPGAGVREAHGELVEQALPGRFVTGVPGVEDRVRARQVERRLGAGRPWHAQQAVEVLARPVMLGVGGRACGQLREDPPPPHAHGLGQRRSVEPLAEAAEPVGVRGIRLAEERTHLRRGDAVADQRRVAGLEPQRHLAADRLQAAGELAHPLLGCVVADDAPAGAVGEPQRRGLEAGGAFLRVDQVRPGDGDLLGLGVAGQVDDLEPVAQRRPDAIRVVGGGDEEDLGQVEGQLDEGVAEAVVLGRVEHLEQDRGRLSAELVELVEHEDRVLAADAAQLAQDRAGLRPLPGAVVAAQVRLVAQAAAGQLGEPAPEGGGDALGQRGLSDSGRPAEADHRAGAARVAAAHGQVLDDARLGVVEAGVPGIERGAGPGQVRRRVAAPVPRQMLEPVDPVVRRRGVAIGRLREALPFTLDSGPHGRGQRVGVAVAEHLPHGGLRDHLRSATPRRPARHHVAADRRQLAVQLGHAGFARVVSDQAHDGLGLEADLAVARRGAPRLDAIGRRRLRRDRLQLPRRGDLPLGDDGRTVRCGGRLDERGRGRRPRRQPRLGGGRGRVEGAGQQVLLRDGQLLLLGARRQLDHGEVLAHRLGDRARVGRRDDPQDRGQVERDIEVRIAEGGSARGVEQVEQRPGGVGFDAVDGLEDEDRVVDAGLAQALDDAAGGAALRPADEALGVGPFQGDAQMGAAEGAGNGLGQRRLSRACRPGQAEDGSRRLGRSRAHGQGKRRAGRRGRAAAGSFDGEQGAGLRAGGQHVADARLDLRERAVGVVQRPLQIPRVEALRLGCPPRQGEGLLGPVQRLADRVGPGGERLADLPPQRLADSGGQAGVVEGGQRLIHLRAGGVERADGRQGRAAVPAGPSGRGPGGGTGRWLARCLGLGRAGQQSERLRRVDERRPAGRGQVGQLPPGALLGGGDHAAAGRRGALRAAERVERPGVFFECRGMDEQHGGLAVSPQQLYAHTVHFLSTIVLLFPRPSRSFHGRPASSTGVPLLPRPDRDGSPGIGATLGP